MKTRNINFSGMICYLDDFKLSIDEFKTIFKAGIDKKEIGNKVQIFKLKYQDTFLRINFSDGSTMPRNPNVYNKSTHAIEDNPRNKDQIEPKEYFAVIDFSSSYLWLSNSKKKKLLLEYLQDVLGNRKLILKDVYDEEKFINGLKRLDQLKFSVAPPNLFIETNTFSKVLVDEMYPACEAELKLTYDKINITENLLSKIRHMLNCKESFKSITISGRDEKNLGMLFNNNLFTRKTEINAVVNEDGMFLVNDVFEKLFLEIKREIKYEKV